MLKFGAGYLEINNEVGRYIQAAGHERRAVAILDDLEANALYLSDGQTDILLVSCDVAALEDDFVAQCRKSMVARSGLNERDIIITCSHTHGGPCLIPTNRRMPVDTEYMDRLCDRLTELAGQVVEEATQCTLAAGQGSAAIGFNRRCCWSDGTHTMHGDTTGPDFTGLEGPEDHDHTAVFVRDGSGKLSAVLHQNTSHPTAFYGSDVYSADFPGAARSWLREAFGPELPVLFLNGALGDISMEDQESPTKGVEKRDEKVARLGHLVAAETMRLLHAVEFRQNVPLAHVYQDLSLEVAQPTADRVAWSKDVLRQFDNGESVKGMDRILAHGIDLLVRRFPVGRTESIALHALRIGDLAMATQPFELYCQFGLDIKRRSPFPMTSVVSLADGFHGYCPTMYGSLGGGYSGEPIYWTRYKPDAGYRVVDAASRLLRDL